MMLSSYYSGLLISGKHYFQLVLNFDGAFVRDKIFITNKKDANGENSNELY